MVVLNQHIQMWQSSELQAGPSGIFTTVLAFEMPKFFCSYCINPLRATSDSTKELRNSILLNAVIQGSHLLCTQQR